MKLSELLKSQCTNLPIYQDLFSDFRADLEKRLKSFGKILDSCLDEEIEGLEQIKTDSKILREGIINTINEYYKGNPSLAYEKLKSSFENSKLNDYLDKQGILDNNSNLYRLRVYNGNYPLKKENLFHLPFELRGKVSTQRYSIPGLPTLYLANSIFVAWEELGRPNIENMQCVRIENKKKLRFLDLTTDYFNKKNTLEDSNKLKYLLMIWPLAAACSFKVKNRTDVFKPEYIIPQLLMQWINKNDLHGIKYSSTHIDLNKNRHIGYFYNYVIPVKSCEKNSGYCTKLMELFKSTQVIPAQLIQFTPQSNRIENQETISSNVNKEISDIELLSSVKQPYRSTYFGTIEHFLKAIKAEDYEKLPSK